jgi:DNA polymerase-3 subunit gamma/tau
MLDNIVGQQEVVLNLKKELAASLLPQALLFYGPLYSGKLTAALEVARVLTCEDGKGEWSCSCSSCEQQRLLTHPGLLLMGPRYFQVEILAAADVLLRTRRVFARYMFLRAVRKLLKRFDRLLWQDDETRIRAALTLVIEIEEELERIKPGRDLPEGEELNVWVDNVISRCDTIAAYIQSDNIPIQQIRKISYWAHLSIYGDKKIIIMENVDRMQESSRNALLKILEEPPENVFFILLTTRKGLVIRTILSRLRPYLFTERSGQDQKRVLQNIFREEPGSYESLRDYFIAWKDLNPNSLKGLARKFIDMVESREGESYRPLDGMSELIGRRSSKNRRSPREVLAIFGEELLFIFQDRLKGESTEITEIETLGRWTDLIHESLAGMDTLNLNPLLVLEDLYYRMREIQ